MHSSRYRFLIFPLLAVGLIGLGIGISPQKAFAVTCANDGSVNNGTLSSFADDGAGHCVGTITGNGITSAVFTAPSDWTNTNTIEVVGAGGDGANGGNNASPGGGGGGGGAYAKATNVTVSGTASFQIGAGGGGNGSGNATWFKSTATVDANGGANASGGTHGAGGTVVSGTGFSGGNGGDGGAIKGGGGGGGGGAAGPNGAGHTGGNAAASAGSGGGGGGGNGGGSGTNGSSSSGTTGANGGDGNGGTGHGVASGGSATAGTGGGGAGSTGGSVNGTTGAGGNGSTGSDLANSTIGSGGGGGGSAGNSRTTGTANTGAGGSVSGSGLFQNIGGGGGGSGSTSKSATVGTAGGGGSGIIVITYTPLANPPTITTDTVDGITKTDATFHETITATGGSNATARGWAYSTNSTLSSGVSTTTVGGSFGAGSYSSVQSGVFSCNTTYYVRAYATNANGTGYGSIISFLTSACAPTVTTTNPVGTSITTTTATLNGNITSTGGASATVRGFAYGTASNLSSVIATTTESGTFSTGAFTAAISSLTCGTTYYARAYATNTGGDGLGSIQSFSTSACGPSAPSVTTSAASSITNQTATLNGNITATGGSNATVRGFAYGTASNLSSVIATTTENGSFSTGTFTYGASGLTCNTTYYFRAYATNPTGTGYGTILNFTSSACVKPTVSTDAASNVSITTATLNGTVSDTGGTTVTTRGFAYSTDSALVTSVSTSTDAGSYGTGSFSYGATGLTCGVTYYNRAYATNSAGTGYGSIGNFTTSCVDTTPNRSMRLFEGFTIKFVSGRLIINQKQ